MSATPQRLFALIGAVVSVRAASRQLDGRERRPYVDLLVGPEGTDPLRVHVALPDELFARFGEMLRPGMTVELNGYLDSVPLLDSYTSELVADSLSILKTTP